jgi:hypothetical protein
MDELKTNLKTRRFNRIPNEDVVAWIANEADGIDCPAK